MANTVFSSKNFRSEYLSSFFQSIADREEKIKIIRNWQKAIENGTVHKKKEEQLKGEFLDKFFGLVLGYPYESHEAEWNIEKEFKSINDGKKPDAALGFFDSQGKQDVRCVIEVKGGLINLDKKQNRADFQGSAVDQAFSYVPRMPGQCTWVIVTNMIEIRFYAARDISRYESFLINELLLADNLQRFFFLLSYNQLFLEGGGSRIDGLFMERQAEQKKISAEFYNAYHDLRLALFADLQKSHPKILPKKLFGHTQKLIDRIIFICFVRDRELVSSNLFADVHESVKKSFRKKKESVWTELKHLFAAMNEGLEETDRDIPEFNGGLFKEDAELNSLLIKDNQLTEIINFVSGYDFQSQLDVNILGHIFEQSISDIEEFQSTLDSEKASEPQISKRKKDGVYYTPDYITRYIVKEAVGGWLDDRRKEIYDALKITELPDLASEDYETAGRTPNEKIKLHIVFWESYREQLKKIKVLDPACGSGAFLTQVFDYLWKEWEVLMAEWNKLTRPWKEQLRDFIVSEPFAVYNSIYEWKAKKNIVATNIFGVDLNPESVEITKLSLWLKTANRKESLADLSGNIKQGNSLIDDPKVAGDDAFDWNKSFAEIMQAGGFDVVVGNPPYVRQELVKDYGNHFQSKYKSYSGKADLYVYFFELGVEILSSNGYLGYITSGKFMEANYGKPILEYLTRKSDFKEVIDFGDLGVFEDISAYPLISIIEKIKNPDNYIKYIKIDNLDFDQVYQKIDEIGFKIISQSDFIKNDFKFIDERQAKLLERIYTNSVSLNEICGLPLVGIKTGFNEGFLTDLPTSDFVKDYIFGKDVKRYTVIRPEKRIIFPYKFNERYELVDQKGNSILSELRKNKEKLEARAIINEGIKNKTKTWFEYQQINRSLDFAKEYIVYPNVSLGTNFSLSKDAIIDMTAFIINSNDRFLLAILNSRLTSYLMNQFAISRRGGYLEYKVQYIEKIPIKKISEKAKQPFITLANKMLELNKSSSEQSHKFIELLQSNFPFEQPTNKLKKWYGLEFIDLLAELEKTGTKIPAKKQSEWLELFKAEKVRIKTTREEIEKTDKEIDQLVYKLYSLTPEEVELVEKS